MTDLNILLSGIVGSTAYGLAHAGSDIDRLAVYAAPTRQLLGLDRPKDSIVTTSPDVTIHELGKYCRLTLKCNPTVLELLWLPAKLYERVTVPGIALRELRTAFLSETGVRNAYLGYATGQFQRLKTRGDGSFSADLRQRTAKHARHLTRLVIQAVNLHRTGQLTIRLSDADAEACHMVAAAAEAGDLRPAQKTLDDAGEFFDATTSALPGTPNRAVIDAWLRRTREELLDVGLVDVAIEEAVHG